MSFNYQIFCISYALLLIGDQLRPLRIKFERRDVNGC